MIKHMLLIDTHTHLNINDYEKDLNEVIAKANDNGIKYFIVPGLNAQTNAKAFHLALEYECIKIAVGIHPCYWQNEDPMTIQQYLRLPQVVAVGEIGIDLYRDKTSLHIQKKNFQIQLDLALKYNLPVILHAREAFEEVYQILLPYQNKIKGVFHCLVNSLEEAQKAIELGFYIGIGGIVTYNNALVTHEVARKMPLDKILLETDSPFLTPFPLEKTKRNEPAYLSIIAEKIAALRQISLSDVVQQTTKNAKNLFLIG
ncbi:TatD family hydrolase [Candidatus Phytoplasma bonamiae]|uniref:TatD family hydrolase n=1 Tax=Candidatus Phytoplasma bonamiae TaxID=2982626 RepID=A0ABT9D375_9MOLU|nr:TatD family hydrolase ['Bonamia sp.' little leaf phytoplasma]MDO8063872.1 TatD family hydrolase ['Bonamia sp.' little leaf phytoplasma]